MGICNCSSQKRNLDNQQSENEQIKVLDKLPQTQYIESVFQPILYPISAHYVEMLKSKEPLKQDGKQYEVVNKTSLKTFTVGTIYKSTIKIQNQEQIQRLSSWISMNHPNIQKWQDVYENFQYYHPVKELVRGVNLFDFLQKRKLTEVKFRHLIQKIMAAVHQLHVKGIYHGDLRCETIIFDKLDKDAQFKIITIHELKPPAVDNYKSPESLRGETSIKSDIWSLGVIIYYGLTEEFPFSGKDMEQTKRKIQRGVVDFQNQILTGVSQEAINLMKSMMAYISGKRPSLQNCMLDSWFSKHKSKLNKKQIENLTCASKKRSEVNCQLKLQKAAMLLMIDRQNSDKETKRMLSLFKRMDVDQSGTLSSKELLNGYSQVMPLEEAQKLVDQIFKEYDVDGSGEVDYNEFLLSLCMKAKHLKSEKLSSLFDEIDVDKSGSLSFNEVKKLFLRLNMSDSEVREAIQEFDNDGDGEISKQEFIEGMMKMLFTEKPTETPENNERVDTEQAQPEVQRDPKPKTSRREKQKDDDSMLPSTKDLIQMNTQELGSRKLISSELPTDMAKSSSRSHRTKTKDLLPKVMSLSVNQSDRKTKLTDVVNQVQAQGSIKVIEEEDTKRRRTTRSRGRDKKES